jgi:4-amino-4-deoxy-L-arabinose transferase-like glycosyltransferase
MLSFLHKHRARLCIAGAVAVFGLILRVNMALNGPVEWDEPVYLNAAIRYAADIRAGDLSAMLNESYNYEHPILYKLIYGAVLSVRRPVPGLDSRQMIAGSSIRASAYFKRFLSLRAVSVVFGSLGVFLLALINPLAGLFLALNTYSVKYTSVIYLEALPLALSIAGVSAYTQVRARIADPTSSRRDQIIWLVCCAACLGAAAASKYIYALAALAVGFDALIYWLQNRRSARIVQAGALWAGLVLVSFLLSNPVSLADPAGQLRRSFSYNISYSQSNDEVSRAGYPFWQPLSWLSVSMPRQPRRIDPFFIQPGNFWLAIDEILFPLALLGAWRLRQKYPVFAIWLIFGLLFLLAWKTKWPQYILAVLAPFCLSAALGAQWIAVKMCEYFGLCTKNSHI